MLIVQLAYRDAQWAVWGETGTTSAGPSGWHSFAADGDALRSIVDLPRATGFHEPLVLPTANSLPIASSPLIAPGPDATAAITLEPWSVTLLPLPSEKLFEFVSKVLVDGLLAPGVIAGTTLKYWAQVARFARRLVAREQFLPGIAVAEKTLRACWRGLIAATDRPRFEQLLAAMPGACRVFQSDSISPSVLLTEFIDEIVDSAVRTSLPSQARRKKFDSVHDQWLHALQSVDGAMKVSATEATALARTLEDWQRPLALSNNSAYRLCFRLEEPLGPGDPWRVSFFLQAIDDPSLLIAMADFWRARRQPKLAAPLPERAFILMSLGQAAKLSPIVERSLNDATPTGASLDGSTAHKFLSETALLLEQAGFGVLLPSWWTRGGNRNRLALTTAAATKTSFSASTGALSLDAVVQFDWRAALGDVELSLQELQTIADLKSPLVQVRGQWIAVNAEELQNALAFWKKKPQTIGTVRDALMMEIGAQDGPAGLRVNKITAKGALKSFLDQLLQPETFTEQAVPMGFQGQMRPYQVRGFSWLAFLRRVGLGACLADDMGLGKSVQTLAMIQQAVNEGETRPVLLICPMSVVGHWKKEAERFTPGLRILVHHGLDRDRSTSLKKKLRTIDLMISSYSLLHRDEATLTKIDWAGVVLDEAQAIKNAESKTAQAAQRLQAGFRIALTGTPVENHVGDLWSISQFLNPGWLGTRASFRREFLTPIQVEGDEDAMARLKTRTGPFLLRRLKTDKSIIADLPEKLENKVYCTLTKEQATLYQAVVDSLTATLPSGESIRRRGMILGALSKLKQVCNHPAQFLGESGPLANRSGKVARFSEMIGEVLQAGDRALVFTQFTEMGELLRSHLQESFGREVLYLHGGVPMKKRQEMVARFQNTQLEDAPQVFLISLKAGGTGLTLTAANHVFHFDRWWNPAVENQATDRAFRIGQSRNVQVHKFVCIGTLEEKVDEMIERKQSVASRVVGTGEGWLTEMSNRDLKSIIALRPDAVEDE